jgi:hypothetical protein
LGLKKVGKVLEEFLKKRKVLHGEETAALKIFTTRKQDK